MKKKILCVISIVAMLSLSACGTKDAWEAFDDLGHISFSDENVLTEEEAKKLKDFKTRRAEAIRDMDTDALEELKEEWTDFKAPIDKLIDEHKAIESTYFSEEQEKRLTPQEKNTEKEVKEAVEQAYKDHDIDKLGQLKTEWDKFSSPIKEVLQTYDGINQSPFEKGESELLSADSKNKINSAKENLDIAMKSRKVENMEKAKERWDTVVSESQGEIDREKDALVLKVANGSNLGGTLGSALSFGTVKSKTSVSGHSITMTAEYNSYFYSDDKIKQQAELYKSYGLGLVKTALKNLKYYVPDASITIQFKNSDGNVIVNMNVD